MKKEWNRYMHEYGTRLISVNIKILDQPTEALTYIYKHEFLHIYIRTP